MPKKFSRVSDVYDNLLVDIASGKEYALGTKALRISEAKNMQVLVVSEAQISHEVQNNGLGPKVAVRMWENISNFILGFKPSKTILRVDKIGSGFEITFSNFGNARIFANKIGAKSSFILAKEWLYEHKDELPEDIRNKYVRLASTRGAANQITSLFYEYNKTLPASDRIDLKFFDIGHNFPIKQIAVGNRLTKIILNMLPPSSLNNTSIEKVTWLIEDSIDTWFKNQNLQIDDNFSDLLGSEYERVVYIESKLNQSKGERDVDTKDIIRTVLKDLNNFAAENLSKRLQGNISKLKASPSYEDKILKILDLVIKGKKLTKVTSKNRKIKSKHIKLRASKVKNNSIKLRNNYKKQQAKIKGAAITAKLQNPRGQFTSLVTIRSLIDSLIRSQVKHNMKSPALNYRTGRFANSVGVTDLQFTREGNLTAFYTYMKSPYQTFERGFKQGNQYRDPRLLIDKSIREVAATYIHSKFNLKTRRL
jgi:hypothetical protein